MDFSLTEEQELLLASIRELITTNFPEEYFRTCDQNGTYPREFMRALADNGISMLGVPEEFGGIPADYVTQMLALMEVSKCGAPAFLITNGQCIHSMRRFGSAEQLRKTAESTLETGDPAYALALTEPGAGSDNNSATTTYTRKNGKVYINGQKTFITGAKEYPYMLVLARDPQPKDPKKAFTLWWVDSSKPGIKINPLHKIGWHMLSTCEVYLDNVEVEESDMVGEDVLSRGPHSLYMVQDAQLEHALPLDTAKALATAVEKIGFDLLIFGEGSGDLYAQQVGLLVGELLQLPVINAVSAIQRQGNTLVIERTLEDDVEVIELSVPAVLCVTSDINVPRIPSMKAILGAGKKPVNQWQASDIGWSQSAPLAELTGIRVPPQTKRKHIILDNDSPEAIAELAEHLKKALN
ncbi:electron transfer flavoprotein [Escherichia coli]|nr:electron transfer flavoprotein [Escherichia coli]EFA7671355.1 electron transfer flavoprotein [Escherichia coli]EFA7699500.1 electron transfer flavoprotein [Escherichia coli]EGK3938859.1 electron transfer flavoprotein [Escherichia coli]HAX3555272.1 electron transfer flavoprotein [Escherichia coli]